MEYNCFLCNYKNQSCVYVMCVWVGENEMRWSRGPRDENIFTPFTSRSHPFLAKNNLNSATILITSPPVSILNVTSRK